MDKARVAELERILLAHRDKVAANINRKVRDLKEKGSSTARRTESNRDAYGAYCDIPEIDMELEASLAQMENNKLTLINEALRRLESGLYGYCYDCGEEISEKRLKALPFAIRCKGCEELKNPG